MGRRSRRVFFLLQAVFNVLTRCHLLTRLRFLHPSPILSRTSRAIAGGKSQPNDCASAAECDSGRPDSKVDATPVSRRKVGERVGARLRICRARPESAQALVRHICCAGKPDIARLPSRSEHGGQSVDVGLLSSAPRASSTHEHAGSGVSSCKTSCLLCVQNFLFVVCRRCPAYIVPVNSFGFACPSQSAPRDVDFKKTS